MSNYKYKEDQTMLPILRTRYSFPSVMDEFFRNPFTFDESRLGMNMPAFNVMENNESFIIEVAAPGMEKNDFKIDLDNRLLTISSEKEYKNEEEKEGKYMRREFSYSSFSRSFTLPESVEADKIEASYKDGVLHLNIPKKEEAKQKPPRQIAVS